MIDADTIGEIIATYQKHGWILRRVLLSAAVKEKIGHKNNLFGKIQVADSDMDAAWFSRPPKTVGGPWEIRYLGDPPFALLENLDETEAEFENALRDVELRLSRATAAQRIGLTSASTDSKLNILT